MSANLKYSYEDADERRSSVIVLPDGRVMETRRAGKTFTKFFDTDCSCPTCFFGIPLSERRFWDSLDAWRATLPAGTETTPPLPAEPVKPAEPEEPAAAVAVAEVEEVKPAVRVEPVDPLVSVVPGPDPDAAIPYDTKYSYTGPSGRCSAVVMCNGRLLEIRRNGATFINRVGPLCTCPECSKRKHLPRAERRTWPNYQAWRDSMEPWPPAPAPVPALVVEEAAVPEPEAEAEDDAETVEESVSETPEERFYERTAPYMATALRKLPSEKDDAWTRRDREAYDAADASPCWALTGGELYTWLAVEKGDELIPVCRYNEDRVLRFAINSHLLTFEEAGISADAILWRRKSEEDPTMVRIRD